MHFLSTTVDILDTDIKVYVIGFQMQPLHVGKYETDDRCLKTGAELNGKK